MNAPDIEVLISELSADDPASAEAMTQKLRANDALAKWVRRAEDAFSNDRLTSILVTDETSSVVTAETKRSVVKHLIKHFFGVGETPRDVHLIICAIFAGVPKRVDEQIKRVRTDQALAEKLSRVLRAVRKQATDDTPSFVIKETVRFEVSHVLETGELPEEFVTSDRMREQRLPEDFDPQGSVAHPGDCEPPAATGLPTLDTTLLARAASDLKGKKAIVLRFLRELAIGVGSADLKRATENRGVIDSLIENGEIVNSRLEALLLRHDVSCIGHQ